MLKYFFNIFWKICNISWNINYIFLCPRLKPYKNIFWNIFCDISTISVWNISCPRLTSYRNISKNILWNIIRDISAMSLWNITEIFLCPLLKSYKNISNYLLNIFCDIYRISIWNISIRDWNLTKTFFEIFRVILLQYCYEIFRVIFLQYRYEIFRQLKSYKNISKNIFWNITGDIPSILLWNIFNNVHMFATEILSRTAFRLKIIQSLDFSDFAPKCDTI